MADEDDIWGGPLGEDEDVWADAPADSGGFDREAYEASIPDVPVGSVDGVPVGTVDGRRPTFEARDDSLGEAILGSRFLSGVADPLSAQSGLARLFGGDEGEAVISELRQRETDPEYSAGKAVGEVALTAPLGGGGAARQIGQAAVEGGIEGAARHGNLEGTLTHAATGAALGTGMEGLQALVRRGGAKGLAGDAAEYLGERFRGEAGDASKTAVERSVIGPDLDGLFRWFAGDKRASDLAEGVSEALPETSVARALGAETVDDVTRAFEPDADPIFRPRPEGVMSDAARAADPFTIARDRALERMAHYPSTAKIDEVRRLLVAHETALERGLPSDVPSWLTDMSDTELFDYIQRIEPNASVLSSSVDEFTGTMSLDPEAKTLDHVLPDEEVFSGPGNPFGEGPPPRKQKRWWEADEDAYEVGELDTPPEAPEGHLEQMLSESVPQRPADQPMPRRRPDQPMEPIEADVAPPADPLLELAEVPPGTARPPREPIMPFAEPVPPPPRTLRDEARSALGVGADTRALERAYGRRFSGPTADYLLSPESEGYRSKIRDSLASTEGDFYEIDMDTGAFTQLPWDDGEEPASTPSAAAPHARSTALADAMGSVAGRVRELAPKLYDKVIAIASGEITDPTAVASVAWELNGVDGLNWARVNPMRQDPEQEL